MGNGVGAKGRLKQPPRKGSRSLLDVVHAEGDHAADVVIVDPGDDWIIPDRNEHMAVDYSLFAGMGCLGRHRTVLLRGAVAYEDGKILDDARRGVFLRGSLPA